MKNITFLILLTVCTVSLAYGQERDFPEWLRSQKLESGAILILPEGLHHARPDDFPHRYLHISNNDDGIKHIVFDLSGLENVTIDGNGAELLMHGHIIPFYMKGAKNITIKNLTIDWANPFFVQGEVTAAGDKWVEVKFEQEYSVEIHHGNLMAINPDLKYPVHLHNLNYIDPVKGEQAYLSVDEYGMFKPGNYTVTKKAGGVFRLESSLMRNQPEPGQIAVFQYEGRTSPAISVQASSIIRIENVTQYHAAAIANIFEGSRNIYIDRMIIKRRGNRWHSALNDATHYVDCSGDIFITNSLFEFQGDDATNIHGIYRTIDNAIGSDGLTLRLMHFQQLGVDTIIPGDTIALCDRQTLEIIKKLKVTEVSPHDHQLTDYRFESSVPDLDWPLVVAMRYETDVNVVISGNTFQNNRARGLLVKTLGKVRIHDNYFHTPGAALLMSGGGASGKWFESGPLDDVEIFNNTFDRCRFGGWSRGLFEIGPRNGKPIIKNIRIFNNRIIQINRPLLIARNAKNIEFFDNEIIQGTGYPFVSAESEDLLIEDSVTTGRLQEIQN